MAKSIRSKRMKRLRTVKRKTWVKDEQEVHQKTALAHLAESRKAAAAGASLAGLKAALAGAGPKHSVKVDKEAAAGAGGGAGAGGDAGGDDDLSMVKKGLTDKQQVAQKRNRKQSKRKSFKLFR